jgi:hypothetical protein
MKGKTVVTSAGKQMVSRLLDFHNCITLSVSDAFSIFQVWQITPKQLKIVIHILPPKRWVPNHLS